MRSKIDCEGCYQAAECLLYHTVAEGGDATSSGVHALYNYLLHDVNDTGIQYLKHWSKLLDLEASAEGSGSNTNNPSMLGAEQATTANHYSLTNLKLVPAAEGGISRDKSGSWTIRLRRRKMVPKEVMSCCLLAVGDRVSLSTELISIQCDHVYNKIPDVEDIVTARDTLVESNICIGQVLDMDQNEIQIKIVKHPRRLFL